VVPGGTEAPKKGCVCVESPHARTWNNKTPSVAGWAWVAAD